MTNADNFCLLNHDTRNLTPSQQRQSSDNNLDARQGTYIQTVAFGANPGVNFTQLFRAKIHIKLGVIALAIFQIDI